MKLKTYLRGLGIGIIVTTIVMAIALGGRKEELSDEEIVVRAKRLGMVESTKEDAGNEKEADLAEPESAGKTEPERNGEQPENEESEAEQQSKAESEAGNKAEPQSSEASEEENRTEPDRVQAEGPEDSPGGAGEGNQAPDSGSGEVIAGEMVSVSIADGEDSVTVSKRLEELDLVVSATQFDRFLCDNGYAKKLSPGDYEIAIGSSEETIAKIITKSR